jgi:hypothetical protein
LLGQQHLDIGRFFFALRSELQSITL